VKAGEVKNLRFETIPRDGLWRNKVDLKKLILFA